MSFATDAAKAIVNRFASSGRIGIWPHIQKAAMTQQLIARIDNPNLIDQQNTPLCGPSTTIRMLALDNPSAYAQAAIDLYTTGKAQIGSFQINPGTLLIVARPAGGAAEADWLLAASIRNSENYLFSIAFGLQRDIAGITTPGSIARWFRRMGYTQIINKTYLVAKPIFMALAQEAQEASRLFGQGYRVLLFIDCNMIRESNQNDLISMFPDHWVGLDSPIRDGGLLNYDAPVNFTIWTWGRRQAVPVNPAKPLTKQKFLHKYYGFVAARY